MYNTNYDLTSGLPDYSQPQFENSQGDPLTSYNADGSQKVYDVQNDTTTAFDKKNNYHEINRIVNDPADSEGYFVSDNGNKYEQFDSSEGAQLKHGIFGYFMGWLNSGGDVAKATDAAYQTLSGLEEKGKRFSKINDLEKAGYGAAAIQSFVDDGDKKALASSKGQWKAQGGYMVNDLTGEVKALPQTAAQQETTRHNQATEQLEKEKHQFEQQKYGSEQKQVDKTIDEGNVVHVFFKDGTEAFEPKTATPDQIAKETTKQQAATEAKREQVQSVATNAGQADQYGEDIKTMDSLKYAGPGWKNKISVAYQGGVGNENPLAGASAKVEQYNHSMSTLGQAALYTEAGNKRIFAKEMESAGLKFIPIDLHTMNKSQITKAIDNNQKIITMYYKWANNNIEGKPAVPNYNASDVYGAKGPGNVPPAQGGAPQAALDHLRSNPSLAGQFKAKYGYLPAGY